jgi:hypothetical protein
MFRGRLRRLSHGSRKGASDYLLEASKIDPMGQSPDSKRRASRSAFRSVSDSASLYINVRRQRKLHLDFFEEIDLPWLYQGYGNDSDQNSPLL